MALVAADKLVVPVNADDFSVAALENMFFSVYGLYSFGGTMAVYEKGMFHSILKEQGLTVPSTPSCTTAPPSSLTARRATASAR